MLLIKSFLVQVPLTVKQCFLLVFAGSLSHFFLDHLFEVMLLLIFGIFVKMRSPFWYEHYFAVKLAHCYELCFKVSRTLFHA